MSGRRHRVPWRAALALVAIVALAGVVAGSTADAGAPAPTGPADGSALYNAGTVALHRGELGEAVAFLLAARRLDPRASDVRANLDRALADAARVRGEDPPGGTSGSLVLAPREAWWLAACLLALGSVLGVVAEWRGRRRRERVIAMVLVLAGLALVAYRSARAFEERAHPEAVVTEPGLLATRGPGEPSRPDARLGAAERVRLGRGRGTLVEIRMGGNAIGWADRAGLWRVSETPRYTARYATP